MLAVVRTAIHGCKPAVTHTCSLLLGNWHYIASHWWMAQCTHAPLHLQLGFLNIVGIPLFKAMAELFEGTQPMLDGVLANYKQWEAAAQASEATMKWEANRGQLQWRPTLCQPTWSFIMAVVSSLPVHLYELAIIVSSYVSPEFGAARPSVYCVYLCLHNRRHDICTNVSLLCR